MKLTSVTKYWSKHRSDRSQIFGIHSVYLLLIIKWLIVTLVKKNVWKYWSRSITAPISIESSKRKLLTNGPIRLFICLFVFIWSSLSNANHERLVSPLIRFQLIALAPIYKLSAVTEPNWKLIVSGAPMSRLHALYCRLAFQRKKTNEDQRLLIVVQVLGVGKKLLLTADACHANKKILAQGYFFKWTCLIIYRNFK